jgi:NAD(P)-dependent dehydrogenase (short-subunit alcohol dehydrogenase family)
MRLKDKVAIVTGGGSGIGKAISSRFAEEGATVVVAARNLERLQETVKEYESKGWKAKAIKTDIGDYEQIKKMVAETVKAFGKIDILVNDAAAMGAASADVTDMDIEVWNTAFKINLTGTMLCCREVMKAMIPQKSGSIINIASVGGIYAIRSKSPYSVSKRAIIGLTEVLALEGGRNNIRVNTISPGATHSQEFVDNVGRIAKSKGYSFDDLWGKIVGNNALLRIAQPAEIGAGALFLASDDSTAVTGHNLEISCGFHITHPSDIQ